MFIGDVDEDGLYESFRKFKAISERVPGKNDDFCPPSLYVNYQNNDYQFYLNNGEIVNVSTETAVTPLEAVNLVKGITEKKNIAKDALEKQKNEAPETKGKKKSKILT